MSPITPSLLVVEVDDNLLPALQLLPYAATVAATAAAGEWYLLRFDPDTGELRYLTTPVGPDRTPAVLRRRGRTVQVKAPAALAHQWVPVGHALARQYLTIAALPLPGQVTAVRALVGRGGANYRVDLQISPAGEEVEFAGATFAAAPGAH